MLKIIYPNCCGIDVHKTFVVAVIAITNKQGITEYHRKRFSTFTNGLTSKLQVSFPMCSEKVLKLLSKASLTIRKTNQTLSSWFTRE